VSTPYRLNMVDALHTILFPIYLGPRRARENANQI